MYTGVTFLDDIETSFLEWQVYVKSICTFLPLSIILWLYTFMVEVIQYI